MTTPSITKLMEYSEMSQASYLDLGSVSEGDRGQKRGQARINLKTTALIFALLLAGCEQARVDAELKGPGSN